MPFIDEITVKQTERVSLTVNNTVVYFPNEMTITVLSATVGSETDALRLYAKLVTLLAEDEQGNKLFKPDDWETLLDKGKVLVAPLFAFVGDLYLKPLRTIVEDKQEDLRGNQ